MMATQTLDPITWPIKNETLITQSNAGGLNRVTTLLSNNTGQYSVTEPYAATGPYLSSFGGHYYTVSGSSVIEDSASAVLSSIPITATEFSVGPASSGSKIFIGVGTTECADSARIIAYDLSWVIDASFDLSDCGKLRAIAANEYLIAAANFNACGNAQSTATVFFSFSGAQISRHVHSDGYEDIYQVAADTDTFASLYQNLFGQHVDIYDKYGGLMQTIVVDALDRPYQGVGLSSKGLYLHHEDKAIHVWDRVTTRDGAGEITSDAFTNNGKILTTDSIVGPVSEGHMAVKRGW